ncbi:hypothetical protein [Haloarchaeobius salinus]|uniref:hypothetical protein n=1 Tax=Haloarchaeobius salinus TaxID=1198298 RepID=UPI00210B6716|nr:hypothetical protein [Haloarchaeobius salinus]
MTVGRSDGQSTGIGVVSAGLSAVYDALGVGGDDSEEGSTDDDHASYIDESITDTGDEQTDDSAADPFGDIDPDELSLPAETDADPSEDAVADDGDGIFWDDDEGLAWSGDDDDDWGFDEDGEETFTFEGQSEPETVRVDNDSFGLDDVRCDDPTEHYETAHDEFKAVAEELSFSGTVDDLELDALTLGDATDLPELDDDDMETVDLDDLTREEPDEPATDDPDWDPGFDGDGPDMEGFNFGVEESDGWN